ncbi:hypothetical protein [uncultured Cohaesibacter sp.]|uniref:hypothetical protein n=1 Tax=uncultured Cohaesibacter sp. TaxID=1002546 RepID=UPI002AAB8974|nr:hypothetical protein [uncultured Cohaesibacter sp.]
MTSAREITIIAAPRTGTNYFCDSLGEFDNFANMFEIFNPRGAFGLARFPEILASLREKAGIDFQDQTDPALTQYVAENRLVFLEILRDAMTNAGKLAYSYKVFPHQMTGDELDQMIGKPDSLILFIVRSRIDTFISYKKAMLSDVWVNADTKDTKPEIEFDEFMQWAEVEDRWYRASEERVRKAGKSYMTFSYEADINVTKPVLLEQQYLYLRGQGIPVDFPSDITPPTFKRQDGVVGPFKKIKNGEELKQTFLDKGLLGKYALRNPLVDLRTS